MPSSGRRAAQRVGDVVVNGVGGRLFPLLPSGSRSVVHRKAGARRSDSTILDITSAFAEPAHPERPGQPSHRILVVALDGVRDVVFTSALTPQLRTRYPRAEITVWCTRYTAPIAALLPGVDRVESADPFWRAAPGQASAGLLSFVRSVLRLRAHGFDLALLTSAAWRKAVVVAATGAPRRIGFEAPRNARWLTDVLRAEAQDLPVLVERARLLEPLGIRSPASPRYQLIADALTGRRERFRAILGPRPVALQPFANRSSRAVPLSHFVRAAVELARRGYDPLWIGSSRQLKSVHRAVGSAAWKYVDKLGEGGLADVAAALSLSHVYVGHESTSLHMAAAFGVPVVGIYNSYDSARTRPQGHGHARVLSQTPERVTADLILEAVDDLPMAGRLRLVR